MEAGAELVQGPTDGWWQNWNVKGHYNHYKLVSTFDSSLAHLWKCKASFPQFYG